MKSEDEIKATNIQLVALILTIMSFFISIFITYNQKRNLEGKDSIYSNETLYKITLFNRIFTLILAFVFLYVNFWLYNISKKQGENLKPYELQILASLLVLISGFITLYVVSLSNTESISDIENPLV